MKTAIKLVLIYFLMQLIGALFAGPFCLLYTYFAYGTSTWTRLVRLLWRLPCCWACFHGTVLVAQELPDGRQASVFSGVSPLSGMEPACRNDFHMYNRSSDVRTYFFCPICWTRHLIYCNPVGWVFSVFLFWDPYWKNCFSVVPLPRSCFADIARQRLSCFPVDIRYLSSESGSDNRCLPHRFLACLALL